jgi:hypothetical protein
MEHEIRLWLRRSGWIALTTIIALGACTDPADPCYRDGPAMGMPAFDVLGSLRNAGAEVEDLGERLESTLMATAATELAVNGHTVLWYEYCTSSVASNDVRRFSRDATTFDGTVLTWSATPHIYLLAQVVLIYEGDDAELLALLEMVVGAPWAEGAGTLP